MNGHTNHPNIQKAGCAFICVLAASAPRSLQQYILHEGVLPIIVDVMERFPLNREIQTEACAAIGRLINGGSLLSPDLKFIRRALFQIIRSAEENPSLLSLQVFACDAILRLARILLSNVNDSIRVECQDRVIATLMTAAETYLGDFGLQKTML